MNSAQKEKWKQFLEQSEPLSDEQAVNEQVYDYESDTKSETPQLISSMGMDMKQFSMTFQGKIDVNMIANSIISIIGQGAIGKVEIVCTL